MKVYLVGGAVRDGLLGRPVHDRDYVVVVPPTQTRNTRKEKFSLMLSRRL